MQWRAKKQRDKGTAGRIERRLTSWQHGSAWAALVTVCLPPSALCRVLCDWLPRAMATSCACLCMAQWQGHAKLKCNKSVNEFVQCLGAPCKAPNNPAKLMKCSEPNRAKKAALAQHIGVKGLQTGVKTLVDATSRAVNMAKKCRWYFNVSSFLTLLTNSHCPLPRSPCQHCGKKPAVNIVLPADSCATTLTTLTTLFSPRLRQRFHLLPKRSTRAKSVWGTSPNLVAHNVGDI